MIWELMVVTVYELRVARKPGEEKRLEKTFNTQCLAFGWELNGER